MEENHNLFQKYLKNQEFSKCEEIKKLAVILKIKLNFEEIKTN